MAVVRGFVVAILALLLFGLCPAFGSALPPASAPTSPGLEELPTREQVEHLVQEHGIETRLPKPSLWSYPRDVLGFVLERILGSIGSSLERVHWLEDFLTWISWAIVALAAFLAAAAFLRWWRYRQPEPRRAERLDAVPAAAPALGRDRERAFFELLDAGRAEAALEALWWWLAEALGADDADASWTTRELVSSRGRRDLLGSVRLFDRLVYGDGVPEVEAVRELHGRLRERLNAASPNTAPAASGSLGTGASAA